jgi:hypothetical protein
VREFWTAGAIAHRPHVFAGGQQAFIDPDVAMLVGLDTGFLQVERICVWSPADSNQKVCAY